VTPCIVDRGEPIFGYEYLREFEAKIKKLCKGPVAYQVYTKIEKLVSFPCLFNTNVKYVLFPLLLMSSNLFVFNFFEVVPRMYALFFHQLSILERATDHECINNCSYSKKKCG
jgi:hypothetical protein